MSNFDKFVEATIESIMFNCEEKKLSIKIISPWDNSRTTITADGIYDCLIDQLRASNIIEKLTLFTARNFNDITSELSRSFFYLLRGFEPEQKDLEWDVLKEKLKKVENGFMSLLEIEPVFGARFIILAKSISFEDDD